MNTCTIDNCDKPTVGRGWCNQHYRRWRKHGDPLVTTKWTCSKTECSETLHKRRYCVAHFKEALKSGEFDTNIPPCSVEGCDRPKHARGMCRNHDYKMQTYGDPLATRHPVTPAESLAARSIWAGSCLEFTGCRDKNGYGKMLTFGKGALAHRVAYELEFGPIPSGMQVDHECRNPSCINPEHLRLATNALNMQNQAPDGRSGKSQYRGVYWHAANQKWIAQVRHEGRRYYLGQFASEHAAHEAAKAKRNEVFVYNTWDRMEVSDELSERVGAGGPEV